MCIAIKVESLLILKAEHKTKETYFNNMFDFVSDINVLQKFFMYVM